MKKKAIKSKGLAWLTTVVMAGTMIFGQSISSFAEPRSGVDNTSTVNVDVSVQSDLAFLMKDKRLSVDSTLSDTYGYEDTVSGKVSALDVLIAAHVDKYGEDQTIIKEKLQMNDSGNPRVMMGEAIGNQKTASGFALNKEYPFLEGSTNTGAMLNQAVVNDGDNVDYFWYEDENYGDTLSVFTDDSSSDAVYEKSVYADEVFNVNVKGFLMMYGYQSQALKEIEGAALCELDSDGNAVPLLDENDQPILTDEKGQAAVHLPAGIHYLTAIQGDYNFKLIMPLLKVTAEKGPNTLNITEETIKMDVSDERTLETFLRTDSADKTITWRSDDEDIVSVKDGVVTGISAGKATITAICGELSDVCTIKVTQPSVKLDRKVIDLEKGESVKLEATVKSTHDDAQVKWSTSNRKIVTVDNGTIKATGKGMACVTASYGDAEATCIVNVEESVVPEKFTIKPVGDGIVEGKNSWSSQTFFTSSGNEGTFKMEIDEVTPADASTKVNWSSDKKNIAVNEEGEVTVPAGIKTATYVTFTAVSSVDNSIKATYSVYILPAWELTVKYSDNKDYVQIPEDGVINKTGNYIRPNVSNYADYNLIEYSLEDKSDESIIELNGQYIIPKKAGTATITATQKNNPEIKKTQDITVKGFFIKDTEGNAVKSNVEKGKTLQLTAETEEQVSWSSSNERVAAVNNKGLVTASGEGQTVITAETSGAEQNRATYEINVTQSGKVYPELLYTTMIGSAVYLDETYTEMVPTKSVYLESNSSSKSDAGLFAVTDTAERTLYMKKSDWQQYFRIGAVFDESKVKVEVSGDKVKSTQLTSAETSSINVYPGNNKIIVKVMSLSDKDNCTEYLFNVNVGLSETDTIKQIQLKPSDRAADTSKTYKPNGVSWARAEGFLYGMNDDGTVDYTKAGFNANRYSYKAYMYSDAKDVTLTATAGDGVSGHISYSTDSGKTWKEGNVKVTTDAVKFDDNSAAKIMVKCVSDKAYNEAKVVNKDPFADENIKVYTVNVEKLKAETDSITGIKAISFDENCTECTPNYKPGAKLAAALVAHDADTAKITFTADSRISAYNGTYIDENKKLTPVKKDSEGNSVYEMTLDTPLKEQGSQINQSILVTYTDEAGNTVQESYTIYLFKIGTKNGVLKGMPDKITDYICPGSQYTAGGNTGWGVYGVFPEKTFMGAGNWYTCISLGNFGGYMTLYYDKPIKDDPDNIYGIDFTVFGNSNGGQGFSEPGNVLVSEDGKQWYSLAGSEHYDANSRWGYEVTYETNGGGAANYLDNDGNNSNLAGNNAYGSLNFPPKEWYPLHQESYTDKVTVKGTRLYGVNGKKGDGIEGGNAVFPAFGYADVHTNSKTTSGTGENVNLLITPVGNPYAENYDGYGDGFDLKWAVDEKGNPVDVSDKEFHYVKVQTASFINSGAVGEKSTEVSAVVRTTAEKERVGTTAIPKKIAVAGKPLNITEGESIYYASVENDNSYDVSVTPTEEKSNIYINNEKTVARSFTSLPDKGIVRIIIQEGEKNPVIYYIHINKAGENAAYDVMSMIDTAKGDEALSEARAAYDALTDQQKKEVENIGKLSDMETEALILKAEALIDNIGEATTENRDKIEAAKKAYDALTAEQKKEVTNGEDLEKAVSELQIADVEDMISEIGKVTSDSKDKLDKTRKAYENLSAEQKSDVANYQTLVNAEVKYENMKLREELAKTKFDAVKVKLSYTKSIYTGKAKRPVVKVTYYSKALKQGTDYTVSYSNNVKVGKAKVTVKAKGEFAGTKTVKFNIVPKGTSITKVTKGSKKFTVKWKKQTAQTTGYQIMYSTSKKFSKAKTVKVKRTATVKTVKGLKGNKKYYVKIRTYKVVGKATYVSNWSKVKVVNTKR